MGRVAKRSDLRRSDLRTCAANRTITRDGRLIDSSGNDLEPEGYVTFYTLEDTATDERQWRAYRARFVSGRLAGIERAEDPDSSDRYYGLASFRWYNSPSFLFGDPEADKQ